MLAAVGTNVVVLVPQMDVRVYSSSNLLNHRIFCFRFVFHKTSFVINNYPADLFFLSSCFSMCFVFCFLREGEKETERGRERETDREQPGQGQRDRESQAGSALSVPGPMGDLNSQTMRS